MWTPATSESQSRTDKLTSGQGGHDDPRKGAGTRAGPVWSWRLDNPQQRYGVSSALGASVRVMRAAQRAVLAGFLLGIGTASTVAQAPKVWTPEELFRRNIG